MWWILFVFLTVITWGSYNLLLKVATPYISPSWALFFVGIAQVIIGTVYVAFQSATNQIPLTVRGALIASVAGIFFALGTISFLYAFKFQAPASLAIALYTVGALLVGVVGGLLLFHEPISLRMVVGIGFAIASIVLLTWK